MLAGLSALELGRLRMSVGYGGHKKGRLYSPVEVASLIQRARKEASLEDCAKAIDLSKSTIGRFLQLLDLPEDLRHLVAWGSPKNALGFSAALGLTRFRGEEQRSVARSILSDGLTSMEVQQVAQLRKRSKKALDDCIKEVLGMRPVVEKRYVFIGTVADSDIVAKLASLTQVNRDAILQDSIATLGLAGASGQLGKSLFTLVGDDLFNREMRKIGAENLEAKIRSQIQRSIE